MANHSNHGPHVPANAIHALDDRHLMSGSTLSRHRADLEDLLGAIPDRSDLQRLYERDVPLVQILQLLGRQVDQRQIERLAGCDDPAREVRRLLRSS